MSFYYTLGNSGRKTGENGVCCILPFDKSLMFKVNTTPRNFDYFTSLDFFLPNFKMFKIKSLFIYTLLVKYSNGEQLSLHKKCQFQYFIPNASSPVLFSAQNIQKLRFS